MSLIYTAQTNYNANTNTHNNGKTTLTPIISVIVFLMRG